MDLSDLRNLAELLIAYSSGSSGRVRGRPRNMKSMQPPLQAIFFMKGQGGHGPLGPPGSATGLKLNYLDKFTEVK